MPEVPLDKVATVAPPAPKLYPDEIAIADVEIISGLSAQRIRKLIKENKIPSQKKNADQRWRFSKAQVEAYFKNRPRGTRTATDGKKAYKTRLTPQQVEAIKKVMPDVVFESAFNYDPAKAKAYRAKKFAAEKAKAAAAPKPGAGNPGK